MTQIPIALQLYSVRHDLDRDLSGTLQAVAEMGYAGVEFAGAPKQSAQELKPLLDEFGLVCCGWHTPFALVQADTLETTIAFNQALENPNVIVPGIPAELRETRDDWLKLAEFFDELARQLAVHGMKTGYHNHHIEFSPLDGERPWDTFFGNTGAGVIMQLDTGNAIYGGGDPVAILRGYPGRSGTVHLKPYSKALGKDDSHRGFQPVIGDDDTPWQEIFDLCETSGGTQWYIVEYESDAYPALQAVDLCLKGLRAMGK
jgi:sugar phosphate isomerase/epimerase